MGSRRRALPSPQLLRRLLADGEHFDPVAEPHLSEQAAVLAGLGLVTLESRSFLRCADAEAEQPYPGGSGREVCDGTLEYLPEQPLDDERECPDCGRVHGPDELAALSVHRRTRVVLNWPGIKKYVRHRLRKWGAKGQWVEGILEAVGCNGFLRVCLVEWCSNPLYLSWTVYLRQPMLYVIASSTVRWRDALAEPDVLTLWDLLALDDNELDSRVRSALVPRTLERYDADDLNVLLDQLASDTLTDVQFEHFGVKLINFLPTRREEMARFLETLRRHQGTVFGRFAVHIGRPNEPDAKLIDLTSYFESLLLVEVADPKHYRKDKSSAVNLDEVRKAVSYWQKARRPASEKTMLILTSSDRVESSAWLELLGYRTADGHWPVVILNRSLLGLLLCALNGLTFAQDLVAELHASRSVDLVDVEHEVA